jgi:RNA polymerase sigma factor (sigma-70 family)
VSDSFENVSDEELARRSQASDWASFDELVRRFEARIYGFAVRCCGQDEAAREVTQETFVSVHQHLNSFDPSLSFATWIFTIARRKCIDRQRKRWRFTNEIPERSDGEDPSSLLADSDDAAQLWRTARRVLSDAQFQSLWLHYAEDLGLREVAKVTRRTQTHVKVLLFRARKILARELQRQSTLAAAKVESTPPAGVPRVKITKQIC